MSEDTVRQDRPGDYQPAELSPQDDARRIEQLKASHRSHHTAGGCAEAAETTNGGEDR